MATQITKQLAKKIARKLKAVTTPGSKHDFMVVEYKGCVVASFGIRRGSQKNEGHDHVPPALNVGPRFAKDLAQCPKRREDWIAEMIAKGIIR